MCAGQAQATTFQGPVETLFQRMHEHSKVLMQNPQEQKSELPCKMLTT